MSGPCQVVLAEREQDRQFPVLKEDIDEGPTKKTINKN